MSLPLVYLAGQIAGMSWKECWFWRDFVTGILWDEQVAVCISPLRGYLRTEQQLYPDTVLSYVDVITTRDRWDMVGRCDLVLANFTGASRVSIGTCIEFGWADALRKPIVTVMGEDNPHWCGMLRNLSVAVVGDLMDGIEAVRMLLDRKEDTCHLVRGAFQSARPPMCSTAAIAPSFGCAETSRGDTKSTASAGPAPDSPQGTVS